MMRSIVLSWIPVAWAMIWWSMGGQSTPEADVFSCFIEMVAKRLHLTKKSCKTHFYTQK